MMMKLGLGLGLLGGALGQLTEIAETVNVDIVDVVQLAVDFVNAVTDDGEDPGVVNGVRLMAPRTATFFEGCFRFGIFQGNIDVVDGAIVADAVGLGILARLKRQFVVFDGIDFGDGDNTLADAIEGGNLAGSNFAAQDDNLGLFSAILVAEDGLNHSPSVFCITDAQCLGARGDNDKFQGVAKRECQGATDGINDGNGPPTCNDFVAFFSLRWLSFVIGAVYVIIILWALYFGYPWLKKRQAKKNTVAKRRSAKPLFDEQQQTVINTLAAQCASAENMLFQATDMLKQAKSMQSIVAVEARRESKLTILTCEYFQAMSSVMVALCHQYLHDKAFEGGYNAEDASVRAMQLEVLNYVRQRLQLAFSAETFTDKSLLRIAEAYAILKKVSENLVVVGFSSDLEVDGSLGMLRTPIVELRENAFRLQGTFESPRSGIQAEYNGQEVCIGMEVADQSIPAISPSNYLADTRKEASNYNPQLGSVSGSTGQSMNYNLLNAGTAGESMQFFVRTFWGEDISALQEEAKTWLTSEGRLEEWLDQERIERERRAAPMVRRGAKKKRKKNKKKGKKKYKDSEETGSQITEYTEASGWSVMSSNTYVFSLDSLTAQGLGIAGKPGLPYERLGKEEETKGRFGTFFEFYFPNFSEWPKFHFFVFIFMPIIIMIPMVAKARKGSLEVDVDGNVDFKARVAGFGISYLGMPAYYFADGRVPDLDELVTADDDVNDNAAEGIALVEGALGADGLDPFNNGGAIFMSNEFVEELFNDFAGEFAKLPDGGTAEIQAGVLAQENVGELDSIRSQQVAQEMTTVWIYALMHTAAYFFGIVPISLIRESLEILARRFPGIRDIYPMSQWRELHMNLGLAGIYFVTFGSTVFLTTQLIAIGKRTPFAGLGGDPNINDYFELADNVLYIRQLLLPAVPLLLLMKYASRGPPGPLRKYAPTWITLNYWEICYFLHYVTALTAIITLVIYRPQVFYWMGATWGIVWGGNKIVRILRTRRCTVNSTNLVTYKVADSRNNAKVRTEVLRIKLNVPASFPAGSRGQACWLTIPAIDYVAHPFTLAKVPTQDDSTIMFHIGIKYLKGDDVIAYARPAQPSQKKAPEAPADPNALPPGWQMATDDESGQTYYYNVNMNKTQWEKPSATIGDKFAQNARAMTSRFSIDNIRGGAGSTRMGQVNLNSGEGSNARGFNVVKRATWTQRLAKLGEMLNTMDADLKRNATKEYPVYVSAPLGTSMDDCLKPSLPGSIIITTQNGLPAGESSVRWLLQQKKAQRPKFHFFVSVSREVNDALSVVETLRDSMCEAVLAGTINLDGLNPKHAHMCDWLGVHINLTRRSGAQIEGDRDMLMRSLNPTTAPVTPQQLDAIETWLKYRVNPGRLAFDRFLQRTSQMIKKRTGATKMAVGYCGSSAVAHSIRSSCRRTPDCTFDGEYI